MPNDKKKRNILAQTAWIAKEAGKESFLNDYTSNISQLAQDTKMISETLMAGKTKVRDVFTDMKQNGGKKFADWFFDRGDEFSDGDLSTDSDSDFDAGFDIDNGGEDSGPPSQILDADSMKGIARGQVSAMYNIAGKQAEAAMMNASQITSEINGRASEIITSINNLNKSVISISEKLDSLLKLQSAVAEANAEQTSQLSEGGGKQRGIYNEQGKVTLGSFFNYQKQRVSDMSDTVKMFLDPAQWSPATVLSSLIDMTGVKDKKIFGKSNGEGEHKDDNKVSYNEMMKTINDTLDVTLEKYLTKATEPPAWLKKIPGFDLFGGFIEDLFRGDRGDARRQANDRQSYITDTYNTKEAKFDGIVRQSIVEIIPGYLQQIVGALTGEDFHVDRHGHLSNKKESDVEKMQSFDTSVYSRSALDSDDRSDFLKGLKAETYTVANKDGGTQTKKNPYIEKMTASATDAAMQSFMFWAIQYFTEEHPRMEVIHGLKTPEFWQYISKNMSANIDIPGWNKDVIKFYIAQLRYQITNNDKSNVHTARIIRQACEAETKAKESFYANAAAKGQIENVPDLTPQNISKLLASKQDLQIETSNFNEERQKAMETINAKTEERLKNGAIDETVGDRKFHIDQSAPRIGALKEKYEKELAEYKQALLDSMESSMTGADGKKLNFSEWQKQLEKKGQEDTSKMDTMSGILSKDAPIPKFHANVIGRLDTIIDLLGSSKKGKSKVYTKYRQARDAELAAEEAARKEAENATTIDTGNNDNTNNDNTNDNNGGDNKGGNKEDDSGGDDDEPPPIVREDPGFAKEMKSTISQFDIKGGLKEIISAPFAAVSSLFEKAKKKITKSPEDQSSNGNSNDEDKEEEKKEKQEKEQAEDAAVVQAASSVSTNLSQDGESDSKEKSLISSALDHIKNPGLKKIVKSIHAKGADAITEAQEKADKKGGIIGKLFGSGGLLAIVGKKLMDFVKNFIAKPFINIVGKPFLQFLKDGISHGFKNVKEGFSELFNIKKKDPEQVKKETDEEKTRKTIQDIIPAWLGSIKEAIENIGKPKPEQPTGGTNNTQENTESDGQNQETWYDKLKAKASGVKTKIGEKLFGTENNRTKLGGFVDNVKKNPVIGAIGKILGPLGKIALGVGQIIASVVMGFAAVKSFSKFVTNVLTKSLKGLEKGVSKILNAVKPIVTIIGNFISKISDFASKIVDSLSGILGTLMGVVGRVLTTILDSLTPFFDAILTVLDTVVDIVTPILDIIIEALSPILDTLGEFLSSVGDIMKDVLAPFVEIIGELLVPVLKLVAPYFELVTSVLSTVAKFISGTLKTTVVPILKTIANAVGLVADGIKRIIGFGKKILGGLISGIGRLMKGVGTLTFNKNLKQKGDELIKAGGDKVQEGQEKMNAADESFGKRIEKQKEIDRSSILNKEKQHEVGNAAAKEIGNLAGKAINTIPIVNVTNAVMDTDIGGAIGKTGANVVNAGRDLYYGSKIPDVDPTKVTGSGDEAIEYQSGVLEEIRDYVAVVPEMLTTGFKIFKPIIQLIATGIKAIAAPITIIAKIISVIAAPYAKLFSKIGNLLFGKNDDEQSGDGIHQTETMPKNGAIPKIDNSKIGEINIDVRGSGDTDISSDTQELINVFKPVSDDVLDVLIDIRNALVGGIGGGTSGDGSGKGKSSLPGGLIDSRTGSMYSDSMTGAGFGASQGSNIALASTPGSTSEFQDNTEGTYGEKILNTGGLNGVISNIRDNSVSVLKSVKEDRLGIFPVLSASLSPISATLMSFFSAFVKVYLPTFASLVNDIAMPLLKQFVKYHDDYTDFQYKIQLPMLSSVRVNMVPKIQSLLAQLEVLLGAMQSGMGQILAGQGMILIALNQPAMGETLFKAAGGLAAAGLNVMMSGVTAQANLVSKQLDNTNQPISELYEPQGTPENNGEEEPSEEPTPENTPQTEPSNPTNPTPTPEPTPQDEPQTEPSNPTNPTPSNPDGTSPDTTPSPSPSPSPSSEPEPEPSPSPTPTPNPNPNTNPGQSPTPTPNTNPNTNPGQSPQIEPTPTPTPIPEPGTKPDTTPQPPPPVIDTNSVGYHPLTDVTGGGDSQGSYGGFMNMGKRGCGPLALADALVRRGSGNVDTRALTKSMAASGAYSQTRGTSVGGFINYARSMGMGYQIGGVTNNSLRRASPNNPITLVGSGGGFGTRNGNNHYINVIGTDGAGGAYVSNPMTGRIERRSVGDLTAGSIMGLYGSGDVEPYDIYDLYGNGPTTATSAIQVQTNYGSPSPYGTSTTVDGTRYSSSNATYNRISSNLASQIIAYVPSSTQEAINTAYKLWAANNKDHVQTYNTAAKWLAKQIQDGGTKGLYWPIFTDEEKAAVNGAVLKAIYDTKFKYGNVTSTETGESAGTLSGSTSGGLTQKEAAKRLAELKVSNPDLYNQLVEAYNMQVANGKLSPDSQPMDWWVAHNSGQFDPEKGNFETLVKLLSSSIISSYNKPGGSSGSEDGTSADGTSYASSGVSAGYSGAGIGYGVPGFTVIGVTNGASGTYKTQYSGKDDERYVAENVDPESLKKEAGNPYRAFAESMKKLQNVFNNILNIFTGGNNNKVRDVLEEEANKESEQTSREYLGNEAYEEYEPVAYKLYQDEHPQNANESDENYAKRLQGGWTDAVRRKYMKRVSKNDLKKTNGLYQTSMIDAANGVSSSTWGDYDKEQGLWTNSALGGINYNGVATVNGGIGSLMINSGVGGSSYAGGGTGALSGGATGTAANGGTMASGDGAIMDTSSYTQEITDVNIQAGATGMLQSPVHEYFSKTGGAAVEYASSGDQNWYVYRGGPLANNKGEGTTSDVHKGIDIWTIPKDKREGGAELHAITGGTVVDARGGGKRESDSSNNGGWGNTVAWTDSAGYKHRYAHMYEDPSVKVGDTIAPGQLLGHMGDTGYSRGSHLHYQVETASGQPVNPLTYFEYRAPSQPLTSNNSSYDSTSTVDADEEGRNALGAGSDLEQNPNSDYWAPYVWNFLKSEGFSDAGAAGVMGNFYRESLMIPYLAEGKGYSPPYQGSWDYTLKADAGGSFVGDSVGYGLAQWTNSSRKQTLLNNAKSNNVSVGSLTAQFATLREELAGSEKAAASVKNDTDPVTAARNWQKLFERAGVVAQEDRDNAAKKYFEQFNGTMGTAANGTGGLMTGGGAMPMLGNGYQFKNDEYLDIWDDTAMLQTPEKRGFGRATRNGGFINYATAAAGGIKNNFQVDTDFSQATLGIVQAGGLSGGGGAGGYGASGALGGTGVTVSGNGGQFVNSLTAVNVAAKSQLQRTYDDSHSWTKLNLNGKTLSGKVDCTGMIEFALDDMGLENSYNSNAFVSAAASNQYPIKDKSGNQSTAFISMPFNKESVQLGDILVRNGHGEVAAGVYNGKIYGWNWGNDDDIVYSEDVSEKIAAGADPLQAFVENGRPTLGSHTYIIRPNGGGGGGTSSTQTTDEEASSLSAALGVTGSGDYDESIPAIDTNKLIGFTGSTISPEGSYEEYYEQQAYELYMREHPQNSGESDENYEKRLQAGWTDDVKRKYMKRVSKDDLKNRNSSFMQYAQITKPDHPSIFGDYDKSTGTWDDALFKPTTNKTSIIKADRTINNTITNVDDPKPQVVNNTTYQIQKSDKTDNERMERLMNHTFNVSAKRVEDLLEKIIDKMDTMTGKKEPDITDVLGLNNNNQNPFPNDDIPMQIQRLSKG